MDENVNAFIQAVIKYHQSVGFEHGSLCRSVSMPGFPRGDEPPFKCDCGADDVVNLLQRVRGQVEH
jgi:hypothetical protein